MTTQTPELEQKLQIEKTDQKKKGRPVSAERLGKGNKQNIPLTREDIMKADLR